METLEPPILAPGALDGTRGGRVAGDKMLLNVSVTPPPRTSATIRFRNYVIEPQRRLLLRNNKVVDVGGRAFDLLLVLLNSRGQVVSKADIFRYVWPKAIVDESNLRFQMTSLRTILGDDRDLIKTIPGRGYLFVSESVVDAGLDAAATEFASSVEEAGALETATVCANPFVAVDEALGRPVAIIDDSRETRESLESLLQSVGIDVEVFSSIQAYKNRDWPSLPSCLVLDVLLPGKSGLDLQAEIIQNGLQLPIIFISGHADVHMCVQAMKAGAFDFLTKPVRYRDLLSAVQLAISQTSPTSNCDMGC